MNIEGERQEIRNPQIVQEEILDAFGDEKRTYNGAPVQYFSTLARRASTVSHHWNQNVNHKAKIF